MWTVILLLHLGALHCTVSSSLPSPINVTFSSVNLRNVLQWFPGSGTPHDTQFTVQYAIYGESVKGNKERKANWRAVWRCTKIVQSWCDLSNETWDLEQGYYARVRAVSPGASSSWAVTQRRFDPKTEISFGPPLVSVEIEESNAIITLKGPMRYQPNNHIPAISMATLYPQMTYHLSVIDRHHGKTLHVPVASSSYKYQLMEYSTEYCFSAKATFLSMPAICQSSALHCITTPQDPVIAQLKWVIVGIVVPSVCVCMVGVVGYLLHRYLSGKGQKSPYILNPPAFHPPVLTFPPEKPNLMVIAIIKPKDPAWTERPHHLPHRPPGYASQSPETLPEAEETWDDSSVDYGFIGVANRREDGNNLKGKDQKCTAIHSYEKRQMSTLKQAHAWTMTQTPLSFQGATMREVDGEEEDGGFQGLFISTAQQNGLLRMPLNLPTSKGGMGEAMDGEGRVRTDGGVEDGRSENEEVPLLSSYASQNTRDMPTSRSDQSDFLPEDYGVLRMAAAHKIEEDEEEEANICIDWNPETGKLVLPMMDGLMQGEKQGGEEEEKEEEEEEVGLRLENVFVRQGSEEKAEAQREMGVDGDDFLTRWNLVVSMDE
ncbi:interleukin-20 receptor subunit alpha [Anoplopoma fimbria]|uniref:interleukin-20 receptor subunit alpha n=1 Tax=Anoplopoma fimbria TaxID=229290 RepID=UPI0023ED1205|nr:interleukin-20 receptor subunit alpha [Anoplopoma fimbria]